MRAWVVIAGVSLAVVAMMVWAGPAPEGPLPEPATRPSRSPGGPPPMLRDGSPRPTSRPARMGRMNETEMAELLGWLQVHQTAIYDHAVELRKSDEQRYRSFMQGIGRLRAEIDEMPAELQRRSWRIREDNVRIAELVKQHQAAGEADRPAIEARLRGILTRQFEDTQKLREYQLELLVKHIEDIREQLRQRLDQREALINQRLEDVLAGKDPQGPTTRPSDRGRRD